MAIKGSEGSTDNFLKCTLTISYMHIVHSGYIHPSAPPHSLLPPLSIKPSAHQVHHVSLFLFVLCDPLGLTRAPYNGMNPPGVRAAHQ